MSSSNSARHLNTESKQALQVLSKSLRLRDLPSFNNQLGKPTSIETTSALPDMFDTCSERFSFMIISLTNVLTSFLNFLPSVLTNLLAWPNTFPYNLLVDKGSIGNSNTIFMGFYA